MQSALTIGFEDSGMLRLRHTLAAGVILAAASLSTRPARSQANQPPPPLLCVTRESEDLSELVPERKFVSAFVSSPVDVALGVYATGWAEGRDTTGALGIEILKNNIIVAKSPLKKGEGRLDASFSTNVSIAAGEQAKISAKLIGRAKNFHYIRMGVRNSQNCPS